MFSQQNGHRQLQRVRSLASFAKVKGFSPATGTVTGTVIIAKSL